MDLFKLKLIAILLLVCCGIQDKVVAMSSTDVERPLAEVLKAMQNQYDVIFSYNTKDVKSVSVKFSPVEKEELTSAINRALWNTGLSHKHLGLNFYTIYKHNTPDDSPFRNSQRRNDTIGKLDYENKLIGSNNNSPALNRRAVKEKQLVGTVTDIEGSPLVGASILILGTTHGTISDEEGRYQLTLPKNAEQLEVSFTGYDSKQLAILKEEELDVQLKEGVLLFSVSVLGSRGLPSTHFDSPVPIDHVSIDQLNKTGENTLDQQLAQIVPSLYSAQHPVSDAAAHFNPVDLKGLLPSRTLVLVNGKRKNTSALLYSYVTASRGEVGVDLKSIMPDAVQSIDVLRDAAAAQYGSDAIAGVINLELKEKIDPFFNAGYSITHEGDGMNYQTSLGFSLDVTERGFATFTLGYYQQQRSQRAGKITSAEAEANHWGTSIFSLDEFEQYLDRNPNAGFQVGLPDIHSFNATINAGYSFDNKSDTELYLFGTLMNRGGRSPQFARGPYWVTGFESIYPGQDFFLPEMAPQIADHTLSGGIRHSINDWKMDLSSTFGDNKIDYFIKNSFNQSLAENSPKDFYNGTHSFKHLVNNLDITKTFHPEGVKSVTLAIGAEQRLEIFQTKEGEFASYGDGTPDLLDRIGSESFSGLNPKDAVRGTRNNIGIYSELTTDINDNLQTGAAARVEHYSDFGTNLSWKWNARYKLIPKKLNLRASVSNGFRAPSLHQIYYASTTTTLTPTGIVQNRILNNLDPSLALLEVPKLKPETSFNLGAGFTYRLSDKISFSADLYKIDVHDRVVLSGQIGMQPDENSLINQFLNNINTESAGFFLNAVNTSTSGIDLIFNLSKISIGEGHIQSSIAANFSKTEVMSVNLPDFIEGNDLMDEVFSREDISRLETWRPRQKILYNITYSQGDISTTVGLNYFGSVTYKHPNDPADDARYSPKTLTNWSLTYSIRPNIQWQVGVLNIFNVYPDTFAEAYSGVPNDRNIDFVGRFKYPWQTMQIGIDGIRGLTKMNFTF